MSHRPASHEPVDGAALAARGVHAEYPGHGLVLDCVNLTIDAGSRLAILGANGSGKTTLLRCLSGAFTPTSGEITTPDGVLVHRRSALIAHRQYVQLVMQDPDDQLFSADVRQDVSFGPMNLNLSHDDVHDRVDEALDLLAITHLADRPVHHLSYGQRKRVAIAGAIALRPAVLLLDEPTAGLDPHAIDALLDTLHILTDRGTTIVMSTHDVDLAWQWSQQAAIVMEGTVVQGASSKILTDADLLHQAHLRVPWPVSLCQQLGVHIDLANPPRTVNEVATAIRV